jgi:hypothetical protein
LEKRQGTSSIPRGHGKDPFAEVYDKDVSPGSPPPADASDIRRQQKAEKKAREDMREEVAARSGSRATAPQAREVSELPAKRGRPKAKSQAKPSEEAPAPASAEEPAVAVAPKVPAGPQPLDKKGKQALQNKIDLLEDDYLETVLRFLEADLGGEEEEEINLDLDNLAPQRQQQLVKIVDEELAKQKARQDAHARGERTPPESPIFDIGKDILTPLQSHKNTPLDPPVSPMQLDPAAAGTKNVLALGPTPTPFPTPSEAGEDDAAATHPSESAHVQLAAAAATDSAPVEAAPVEKVVTAVGQSVGELMEDTISRAVRKAVKATPELTESKTPRASPRNPACASGASPKTRAPDSMLDILNEDDEFMTGIMEEFADIDAADAKRAASGTGMTGISGESA